DRLGCGEELKVASDVLDQGASYERQRAIRADGGTLENIVTASITEFREDRFVSPREVIHGGACTAPGGRGGARGAHTAGRGAHMTQPGPGVMPGLEPVPDADVRPAATGAARLQMQLDAFLTAHEAQLIDFRRTLHMHPELGFEEHLTTQRLADRLTAAGLRP